MMIVNRLYINIHSFQALGYSPSGTYSETSPGTSPGTSSGIDSSLSFINA
jgi:hypothetical protein